MAPQFNPSAPCALGPEWMPYQDSLAWMGSTTQMYAAALVASSDESISALWWDLIARFDPQGVFACEIFDITGDQLPAFSDLVTTTYRPDADLLLTNVQGRGPFSGYADVTVDIFQAVNDTVDVPGTDPYARPLYTDSYIRHVLLSQRLEYACALGSVAGTLTGQWISSLVVRANVVPILGVQGTPTMTIECYIQLDGTRYSLGTLTPSGNTLAGFDEQWVSFANPSTGAPWTAADVEKLDSTSGTTSGVGFVVSATNDDNLIPLIARVAVDVISSPTDERLAFGYLNPQYKQGWQEMELLDPATGVPASWVKEASHKYLLCIRETKGAFPIAVGRVDEPGRFLPGPPRWSSYLPETSALAEVQPAIRPRALGDEQTPCYPLGLELTGGGFSLDSQPYFSTSPTEGQDALPDIGAYFDNAPVNIGRRIEQEFTTTATRTYGWLQVMVAMASNLTVATLIAEVFDRATDTLHATFHITPADLTEPRRSWQRVGVPAQGTPLPLAAGEQFYLRLRSTAAADVGWLAQVLNGGTMLGPPTGPPPGLEVANYGGTTDRCTINGVEQDHMDLEFVLSTLPPVPIDVTAVAAGESCGIDFAIVSWDDPGGISGCGLAFAAWEVERSDDGGTTWYRIQTVTDQATLSIDDYETKRNREAQWRVRTVREDGARSAWSDVATATVTLTQVGLVFTSNVMPELTCFSFDIGGQRDPSFLENQTMVQPRGRKFQIFYRELEDRGVQIPAKLLVRAGTEMCSLTPCADYATVGITDVFAPLLAICREALPYVCVCNEAGDRWFANIASPAGSWRRSPYTGQVGDVDTRGNYTLDVVITEVSDRPFAPQIVPGSASGSGSGSGSGT